MLMYSGTVSRETAERVVDAFANEILREDAEKQKAIPRAERSRWHAIADALNAAHEAGMPVGIDLDGTLTDRNAWSVIWDRDAKQWVLAGFGAEAGAR
jgi:hypothetical protein